MSCPLGITHCVLQENSVLFSNTKPLRWSLGPSTKMGAKPNPELWLATQESKMVYVAHLGLSTMSCKKTVFFFQIINPKDRVLVNPQRCKNRTQPLSSHLDKTSLVNNPCKYTKVTLCDIFYTQDGPTWAFASSGEKVF